MICNICHNNLEYIFIPEDYEYIQNYMCDCNLSCNLETNTYSNLIFTSVDKLRKLYSDRAIYINILIYSILNERINHEVIKDILLFNQKDIGEYFGRFLGNNEGEIIHNLFKENINILEYILIDLRNKEDTIDMIELLFDNIEDISITLSNILTIPYKKIFKEYSIDAEYMLEITQYHYVGKLKKEKKTYEEYHNHSICMADILYSGLFN